jgi:hypothetical protein
MLRTFERSLFGGALGKHSGLILRVAPKPNVTDA